METMLSWQPGYHGNKATVITTLSWKPSYQRNHANMATTLPWQPCFQRNQGKHVTKATRLSWQPRYHSNHATSSTRVATESTCTRAWTRESICRSIKRGQEYPASHSTWETVDRIHKLLFLGDEKGEKIKKEIVEKVWKLVDGERITLIINFIYPNEWKNEKQRWVKYCELDIMPLSIEVQKTDG